ncbi:hypothetical protein [Limnohabitans sp. MMS-10A-178]|jgi:hypothetical protein|uniref:hypothetical protein n=1 Tax=Limnohabitans sp. MMS-10A-178 TaxID=1835767 RepID=UPI0011B246AB|nr:hypothetical protein [Limnohabitans sp. MMS-10A-178]
MQRQFKTLTVCLVAIILCGCASTKIINSSNDSVVVDIKNTALTTEEMIKNGVVVADKHCKEFNKKAVLKKRTGIFGVAHLAYFSCK